MAITVVRVLNLPNRWQLACKKTCIFTDPKKMKDTLQQINIDPGR